MKLIFQPKCRYIRTECRAADYNTVYKIDFQPGFPIPNDGGEYFITVFSGRPAGVMPVPFAF